MNKASEKNGSSYKSFLLLDEISKGEPLSQRGLSRKLDIALGLVNSYLKHLVGKGFIKISEIPPRRYAYYLTPQGFSEKTRLTYHYLQNYTSLYRTARKDFKHLFRGLLRQGVTTVAFAGIDEFTEIAYLSLQEADISLQGAVDDEHAGERFFKVPILPLSDIHTLNYERVILTTFIRGEETYNKLLDNGVFPDSIYTIDRTGAGVGRGDTPALDRDSEGGNPPSGGRHE